MQKKILALAGVAMLGLGGAAQAQIKYATGTANGLTWEAQSRLVAMTSTGGATGGGNPLFLPNRPQKNGVVSLIMDYGPGGAFICTGSLLSDRRSIVTAAHCVSDGAGTANPLKTTAYFYGGDVDTRLHSDGLATAVDVTQYFVHEAYTGEVIDQNDIAVLRLAEEAPDFAIGYRLAGETDLTGEQFNVAGVGGRSSVGGALGVNQRTGYLREGDNIYDYRWGDDAFGGFFTDVIGGENFFGTAEIAHSWVSDFDSGFAANDMSCRIAAAVGAPGFGCNLGVGAREVGVAGGDSGGPGFLGNRLASVNSYGLSFGTGFGDCVTGLNSSCGEYSGYVPIYLHTAFIANSAAGAIPEPGTWAMLIAGFGLVGAAARRTRRQKAAA